MSDDLSTSERIAAEVRAILARKRIPQAELAQVLDISQVGVSRRLRGETPLDVNEVALIAAYLGVPIGVLYGEQAAAS